MTEDAGSGVQLIQDPQRDRKVNLKGIIPKDEKATRLLSVSTFIAGGHNTLPKDVPWRAAILSEIAVFPKSKHDDQVDSLSQFLKWLAEPHATPSVRFLTEW